jgi:uncharacterized membrane protein YeaQ/YmgE (transglycosylase-associated protein family)
MLSFFGNQEGHSMHVIAMLIVGLIAGALAKLIMPGRHSHSIISTMLVGVVGAFVAGFIGRAVGWYETPGDGPGIIASTVGAIIVLAIYHLVMRNRTATSA